MYILFLYIGSGDVNLPLPETSYHHQFDKSLKLISNSTYSE